MLFRDKSNELHERLAMAQKEKESAIKLAEVTIVILAFA